MDRLTLTTAAAATTTASNTCINRINIPTFTNTRIASFSFRNTRIQSFSSRRTRFRVLASKDDESRISLDQWDQMELKFGQMIGEDPKLTLAKVMSRKANPDVSYLDIEKSFNTKKGKLVDNELDNIAFEGSKARQPSPKSLDGLNLVRPIPKTGVKFETEKPPQMKIKKPNFSVENASDNATTTTTTKGSIPNVILRKPTTFKNDDDADTKKPSRLMIKPNLFLKMRNEQKKEQFSDITLLKRPESLSVRTNISDNVENSSSGVLEISGIDNVTKSSLEESSQTGEISFLRKSELKVDSVIGLQPPERSDMESGEESSDVSEASGIKLVDSDINLSTDAELQGKLERLDQSMSEIESDEKEIAVGEALNADLGDSRVKLPVKAELQGKPKRLDQSVSAMESDEKEMAVNEASVTTLVDDSLKLSIAAALQGKPKRLDQKDTPNSSSVESVRPNPESYIDAVEIEGVLETSSPLKGRELVDWTRAEDLFKKGTREEVELISSSTRGFVASFGSLIGFLPYRNLAAKWKFLAFESWLRRKGLDPSTYKQNLGIIGSQEVVARSSLDSIVDTENDAKTEGEITPDTKLDDLLRIYENEKIKFLSSFVGQKIKVNVVIADRNSRKLIFSGRPREKEEMVEKKRSLMAKLSIGDVVKCCIKKITYFGIFVEVAGVPALIHQTEVSWDATLDPVSFYKVGQIVDAKVHQLDFTLERITLSLKEITPDPLIEALESVVGDRNPLDGRLETAEADSEWDDVESLIKELQQIEGVESVSKGRFFLSPGLAPTFQVYMASMFENQYKLLARSENKVQEVVVKASLDKEQMKNAILTCTNRVE